MKCPNCGSSRIIKKGTRKLKRRTEQVYYCNNCGKKFVNHPLKNKSYSPQVIVESMKLYNSGKSLSEASKKINQRFKVNSSKSTIYNWVREYRNEGLLNYLKLRKQYQQKYGDNLIKQKLFQHSELEYLFKYHRAKLGELKDKFPKLTNFIENLPRECPDKLFNQDQTGQPKNERSSKLDLNINPQQVNIYTTKNKACELADFALTANNNRRERHQDVQDLMLKCDNATFAVEVPVWWYHKGQETTITGHIDFLQERADKIFILDYKPKAKKKTPLNQLYSYAKGLSYRTGISLNNFRAAWFNEDIYQEFNPNRINTKV